MDWNVTLIVAGCVLAVAGICSTIMTIKAPISEFGDDKQSKYKAFKKLQGHTSIILGLCIICVSPVFIRMPHEVPLILLAAGVTALGIKAFDTPK